jgi:hypothetical protein
MGGKTVPLLSAPEAVESRAVLCFGKVMMAKKDNFSGPRNYALFTEFTETLTELDGE